MVALRFLIVIFKPNFFDNGPLTPRSCRLIPDFPSTTSSTSFNGLPPNVVIHHADHEIHRITLFFVLPSILSLLAEHGMILNCFSRFPGNEEDAQKLIATALTPSLQNRYRWGINTSSTLPHGFVHLKRKKMFNKGRTLISYFGSRYGKLMQATARTLDTMCVMLWPQEAGQLSVPAIWKHIHQRFFSYR